VLLSTATNNAMQLLSQINKLLNLKEPEHKSSRFTERLLTFSTRGKHELRVGGTALGGVRRRSVAGLSALGFALVAAGLATAGTPSGAVDPCLFPCAGAPSPVPTWGALPGDPSKRGCADSRELWLDLSEPALSSIGHDRPAERVALLARIERQQDEVLARVRELGGEETARVKEVRNAVAVKLPAEAAARARQIPGVLRVRPVQHRNRIDD
jgi:hypothetical protein